MNMKNDMGRKQMNKLTKEQASELIAAIDKLKIGCPGGYADGFWECREDIKNIINQCTEVALRKECQIQKLTTEQAEELKDYIASKWFDGIKAKGEVFLDDITLAINQCTEKEFPEFKISTEEDNLIYITDIYEPDKISIDTFGKTANCTHDEFKAFTNGCIKILEWLNDNT